MSSCMNLGFYIGSNLILVPKFDVENVVKVIEQTKPTIFPGVPTMFISLLKYSQEKQVDLSYLKTCTRGSEPLPLEILQQFNKTSQTNIAEVYCLYES